MPVVIGADEAGYGPKLGPLVVSATMWEVPDGLCRTDLYDCLAGCVTRATDSRPNGGFNDGRTVVIADSKSLYQPSRGLAPLEFSLLAALACIPPDTPPDWRAFFARLDPLSSAGLAELPWYRGFDSHVPVAADVTDIQRVAARLQVALASAGVRLCGARSRVVFAGEFNQRIATGENKATLLSQVTIELVGRLLAECGDGPAFIVCDKHGGRNRYGAILQRQFPDTLIEVRGESRAVSVYRWGPERRRIEAQFRAGAESHLAVALASMASKYLRELAMRAFNDFWRRHLPALRPTAGYPADAARFKREIAKTQRTLGIEDRLLWRNR